jgi:type VI secretion system secreted protein Hcp
MSKRTVRAVLMAAFLVLPCAASAAVDYFLKIDGIDGESTEIGHKGELEIESWSWGVSSASGNGASRAGKPCVASFNFSKRVDKATPQLMANAVSGMHIKSAVLTARKAGDKPLEYLKITLETVLVSSYQVGGSNGSLPVDQFSLDFAKMNVEYKVQRADGTLGDASSASFLGGC